MRLPAVRDSVTDDADRQQVLIAAGHASSTID
jgi:hypothetical protein